MARRGTVYSRRSQRRRRQTFVTRAVLCKLSGVSERQLSIWEREELIAPAHVIEIDGRSEALYSNQTLARVRVIRTLAEELEVNLPGIDVILNLLDRLGG